MARILKHEIPAASEFKLPLHEGSNLLKLDVVNEKVYIWALEDESKPKRGVKFRMVMTGEEINLEPYMMYIGTFILFNGSFVGLLFVDTSVPMPIYEGI
ncbi:DUF7352 domain-containing protein [Phocaeicola plebeius]|uniref:DUF7352 domain-containing protein n=1 Tax=Phocaeicola plebeius TaxID=310297 RepID=UPI003FD7A685